MMLVSRSITVLVPCFNERDNIHPLYVRLKQVWQQQTDFQFELLFVDNSSSDGTALALREFAAADPTVKVIVNQRNFGHVRSPFYGLLQAPGDAVIVMAADLQ